MLMNDTGPTTSGNPKDIMNPENYLYFDPKLPKKCMYLVCKSPHYSEFARWEKSADFS